MITTGSFEVFKQMKEENTSTLRFGIPKVIPTIEV